MVSQIGRTTNRRISLAACAALLACAAFGGGAAAQVPDSAAPPAAGAAELRIEWEVKNRFRLFRDEKDFQHQVAAFRADGILAAEARLARASDGLGWARDVIKNLCVDAAGRLTEFCVRDGKRELYLAPDDHRITAIAANAPAGAVCAWTFDDGEQAAQQVSEACEKEVTLWVRYGRTTKASVEVTLPDQT